MKKIIFWILAVIITLASAKYQRTTGPTYPVDGVFTTSSGVDLGYSFTRSHGGDGDQPVLFDTQGEDLQVYLKYKRFKLKEQFTVVQMTVNSEGILQADLPHQPPAGKLEYLLEIREGDKLHHIPEHNTVVTRFKGHVPAGVLIPHILFMFLAMLLSSRTGIEALDRGGDVKKLTYWTTGFLFVGGMILGPIVQKFAFGEFWTGIPFGWDLTDNKTLIAMLGWAAAVWAVYRSSDKARFFALAAAVILFAVYLIPHSAMGSELDYETGEIMTGSVFLIPVLIPAFRRRQAGSV